MTGNHGKFYSYKIYIYIYTKNCDLAKVYYSNRWGKPLRS